MIKTIKTIVLVLALLVPSVSWSAEIIALWRLDGNFLDTSGNGYDIDEVGTVPFVTRGGLQGAGTFSGANYLSQTASAFFTEVDAANDNWQQEWDAWFDSSPTKTMVFNHMKYNPVAGCSGWTNIQITSADAMDANYPIAGVCPNSSGGNIGEGSWVHVIVTWDGTNRMIFFDGTRVVNDTVNGQITPPSTVFWIGRYDTPTLGLDEGFVKNWVYLDAAVCSGSTCTAFPLPPIGTQALSPYKFPFTDRFPFLFPLDLLK